MQKQLVEALNCVQSVSYFQSFESFRKGLQGRKMGNPV